MNYKPMTQEEEEAEIAELEKRFKDGKELNNLVRVKARVAKNPFVVFSVRMSPEELSIIAKAAGPRKVGDFIRRAALAAAAGDLKLESAGEAKAIANARKHARALTAELEKIGA